MWLFGRSRTLEAEGSVTVADLRAASCDSALQMFPSHSALSPFSPLPFYVCCKNPDLCQLLLLFLCSDLKSHKWSFAQTSQLTFIPYEFGFLQHTFSYPETPKTQVLGLFVEAAVHRHCRWCHYPLVVVSNLQLPHSIKVIYPYVCLSFSCDQPYPEAYLEGSRSWA